MYFVHIQGACSKNGGGGDRERAPAPAFRADKAGAVGVGGGDAQASTAGTMFAGEKLALCVEGGEYDYAAAAAQLQAAFDCIAAHGTGGFATDSPPHLCLFAEHTAIQT